MFKRALGPMIFLSVALAGCETIYAQPPAGPAVAVVTLDRDPDLDTFGTGQLLSWSADAACSNVMKIAAFDPMSRIFGGVTDAEFRLPGGETAHLLADIYGDPRSAFQVVTACTNLVRFTPAAGGRYRMIQRFADGQCEATVTDTATGEPPADFTVVGLSPECIKIPTGYQRIGDGG